MIHNRTTRLRDRPLVLLALLAGAVAVAVYLHSRGGGATGQTPLPSTYGPIHMVGYLEGGAQPAGSEQLKLIAGHDAIVIAQPPRMVGYASELKRLNPRIELVLYENGMFSTPTDPPGMPESWYLHTAAGQRVRPTKHGQNALMNPLSTASFTAHGVTYHGWADYVAHECVADQSPHTNGCYLDMLGIAPLHQAYDAGGARPVDPGGSGAFTPGRFEEDALYVAAAVRSGLPHGSLVLANGYLNGEAYVTATHGMNRHVDAAQAQDWLGHDATSLPVGRWKRDVQMVISSGLAGAPMMVRYTCDCSGADVQSQRTYALATYLLANTGRAFFDFQHGPTKEFQDWSLLYDLNLGRPTTTFSIVDQYRRDGVYQRAYSGGLVLVNPSQTAVTVPVRPGLRTVAGDSVQQVTLTPASAAILVG